MQHSENFALPDEGFVTNSFFKHDHQIAAINIAREAIQSRKRLSLQYGGHSRVVEVHAVGITKDGNPIARGWQVSGGSNSDSPSPWKLLRLDRATQIAIADQNSEAPREGYKPDDHCIHMVLSQI